MGAELPNGLVSCGGCGAGPGANHLDNCDWARCPECGQQLLLHDEHYSGRPSIWRGVSPDAAVARQLNWWTTAVGIDHLVEDYTRVLFADALHQISWDPVGQQYVIGQINEAELDAAIRRSNEEEQRRRRGWW